MQPVFEGKCLKIGLLQTHESDLRVAHFVSWGCRSPGLLAGIGTPPLRKAEDAGGVRTGRPQKINLP